MNMKLTILTTTVLLATTNLSSIATAENLQHIQKLLSTKQCQQCELSGAGLVLADLGGAQLSRADLTRANLSGANLSGADLTGANLTGASLNGANLTGANLSGANISSADLRGAYLGNAKLFGVNLNTAYVQGAIGIPPYAGTPEDFYAWGVSEANRGNYSDAIAYFNQALSLKPNFALAFLARGVASYKLGQESKAIQDAQSAATLFTAQGNTIGYQSAQNLIKGIELAQNPPKSGGFSLEGFLGSIGSVLLQLL